MLKKSLHRRHRPFHRHGAYLLCAGFGRTHNEEQRTGGIGLADLCIDRDCIRIAEWSDGFRDGAAPVYCNPWLHDALKRSWLCFYGSTERHLTPGHRGRGMVPNIFKIKVGDTLIPTG